MGYYDQAQCASTSPSPMPVPMDPTTFGYQNTPAMAPSPDLPLVTQANETQYRLASFIEQTVAEMQSLRERVAALERRVG